MIIKTKQVKDILQHQTPFLVVGVFEDEFTTPLLKTVNKSLNGAINDIVKEKKFRGKTDQARAIYTQKRLNCDRILLIGLGSKREISLEKLRRAAGTSATLAKRYAAKSFSTLLSAQLPKRGNKLTDIDAATAVSEGTALSQYEFTTYKTENDNDDKPLDEAILLLYEEKPEIKKAITFGVKLSEAVCHARDLVNHPGNTATPTFLAAEAKKVSKLPGVKCKIMERPEMEKVGMGALLAVAKGSSQPPKFIILEYSGSGKKEKPVVIVGKGLTFDSGGISLKPGLNMEEMKMDMAGGAVAITVIEAAAKLKLKKNLVALIPSTENMPGGRANKPGDVLKSLSGKTIEVINTDAEGRLILADALTWAKRYKPEKVIDLATLTGACIIALGHNATAVLGNDPELIKAIKNAGEETGERVWELPLWEEYDKQIKSNIADVKNTGGRSAGTITAAAFLKKFAGDYNWAHLDIAGTAWSDKRTPYVSKGGTGVGVRLLIKLLTGLTHG